MQNLQKILNSRTTRTPLIAYTAPVYKGLRTKLDAGVIEKFRRVAREGTRTYVDLNLIFPDWDIDHFDDATHITTAAGREHVTPIVMGLIHKNQRTSPKRSR